MNDPMIRKVSANEMEIIDPPKAQSVDRPWQVSIADTAYASGQERVGGLMQSAKGLINDVMDVGNLLSRNVYAHIAGTGSKTMLTQTGNNVWHKAGAVSTDFA